MPLLFATGANHHKVRNVAIAVRSALVQQLF